MSYSFCAIRLPIMPSCPICAIPLKTVRQREGVFYLCSSCDGRAATISQIRRVFGDAIATRVLRIIKLSRRNSQRNCPFCASLMQVLVTMEPAMELEACRACNVIWFDLPTYETLPQLTSETTNSIPAQANELIALDRLKELKARQAEELKSRNKTPLHRMPKKDPRLPPNSEYPEK
jgi:Zn-finger nucleic acid-binding protein